MHDDAIWTTFCAIVHAAEWAEDIRARKIASMSIRLGGMGLRTADRTAPAVHTAAWLDAMPKIEQYDPLLARRIRDDFRDPTTTTLCIRRLHETIAHGNESGITFNIAQHFLRGDVPDEPTDPIDVLDEYGGTKRITARMATCFELRNRKPL